ncbi:MAG TPA: efflux RND transporter periplasmic adaptor subunit [Pirellulales bacterium]|nr:efflux RND transporter periplasmic adaptor subunit [Pirellulales bacterium]
MNPQSAIRHPQWVVVLLSGLLSHPTALFAHGDHEALPAKGAAVHGDQLFLSPSAQKALGVKLVKVTLSEWERTIGVNAVVDLPCGNHAYTSTLVAGRIERILARAGDSVEAGQELARVESMDLESLRAALLAAEIDLKYAEQLLAQTQTIAASGGAAQKDVFAAQSKCSQAKALFQITRLKLRSVGLTTAAIEGILAGDPRAHTLPITSPIGGEVSLDDVRVGQAVEPLDQLFQVVDRSTVMVVGHVLESDAGRVRTGMPVTITLAAMGDREFTGHIDHVGLKVDGAQRTVLVRMHMQNPGGLLRPGMFGRMRIQIERRDECVLCPSEALFEFEGETCALLRQGPGKFVRRGVTVGGLGRQWTEIIDGLFPGQRVVTVGRHELAALFAKETQHGKETESDGSRLVVSTPAPNSTAPNAKARNAAARNAVRTAGYEKNQGRSVVVQGRVVMPTERKRFATSAVEGRIEQLLVERGDRVRGGQVLATIDSLQLRNLEFDLLAARAKLALNERSLDRLQGLDLKVAKTSIWQLQAERGTLESNARSIGDKLRLVGLATSEINQIEQLELSNELGVSTGLGLATSAHDKIAMTLAVRAPADGWVVDFELGLGQVVRPADHLFEIQDLSTVWVQAHVFERDAARVSLGQGVEVTVAAEPGLVARGRIDRISPVLDGHDRLLAVWTELDNSELRLKEGMLARVEIAVDAAEGAAEKTRRWGDGGTRSFE